MEAGRQSREPQGRGAGCAGLATSHGHHCTIPRKAHRETPFPGWGQDRRPSQCAHSSQVQGQ